MIREGGWGRCPRTGQAAFSTGWEAEEHDDVEEGVRRVEDRADVEVAEERAREGDEGGELVVEALHHRAELHVEHDGEGEPEG